MLGLWYAKSALVVRTLCHFVRFLETLFTQLTSSFFFHYLIAYNGTKLIYFGGNTTPTTSVGSIYILDVPTLTWKQGESADPSQNRSSMACGVSGDNFITWGGNYKGFTLCS
jgi:hypothetical protein